MNQRFRFLFYLAIVSFFTLSFDIVCAQQKKESSPAARKKAFELVWKTINDKYFDPGFGGVDWAAMREQYAPQIAAVKSDAELHGLLRSMIQVLHVSHLSIVELRTLNTLSAVAVTTGLDLRDLDVGIVVTRVLEGSPAQRAGLRVGFAIKRIDGAAATKARDAENKLSGVTGSHRVGFLDERDALRETVLENHLPGSDDLAKLSLTREATWYALLESKRLANGIGYIHFTNFIGPIQKKLATALDSMKDAPGLIIDLRSNSGGDDSVGLALAGMLLEKETQLAISRTHKGDNYYYKATPQKNPFTGPVVMLLDETSGSESEQIAAGLQEVGRAVVIGKKTAGSDMDAEAINLPTGAALFYPYGQPRTPKGVIIEGYGVKPDIEVNLTRAELLKGNDSQLEAAIEYIQKKQRR